MTRHILWRQPAGDTSSKGPGFREALRRQFRAIMRAITRPALEPESAARRRKSGDTTRSFGAAAGTLFRRLVRRHADVQHSHWDTFTWLRIWDHDDGACVPLYEDSARAEQQHTEGPSLRL